jgi:predicted dehydrogenase
MNMPTQPLRWGLLSTARINKALFTPLRTSKRNRLLAVASRSQEKAGAYAHEKKIQLAYGSYEALLADPEIDVIYNSLPNHLHAEWTIKAVEAGKHVLCEKPLALSTDEVDSMDTAAEKYGKVVAEAFMYRSHPKTLKVKEIVDSGELGQVKIVRSSFTFVMTNPNDYRWKPEMGGGGLWDIGCYPLSYPASCSGRSRWRSLAGRSQVQPAWTSCLRPSCVSPAISMPNSIAASRSRIIPSWKLSATRGR